MFGHIFSFFVYFLALMPAPAAACVAEANQSIPRTLFGLYDGGVEKNPADTRIHRFLELPLSHLGYRVHYFDVSGADLPESDDPTVAGAISWFDSPLLDPERFAAWAADARSDCPDAFSFIVLGETGLRTASKPRGAAERYLRRLGLSWIAKSTLLGDLTSVVNSDPALLGFESDFVFRPGRYVSLRGLMPAETALSVVPAGKAADDSIDLVVQHHPNLYVHQSATLDADVRSAGHFWIMDPFAILGRALSRTTASPVPDVTTLNGKRIYFETVGPEGWLAPGPARTFDEEPRLGSENLLLKLIMPFGDLPTTVSVVAGDLDTAIGGKLAETGRRAADSIFALPQTAVATSGRSLVRHWAAISESLDAATTPTTSAEVASSGQTNSLLVVLGRNLREAFADPQAPPEPQLSDGLRQYSEDPFVVRSETIDAIKIVQDLTPNKRTPPLFLWSGDGKPGQDVRAAVAAVGSRAFGGGITAIGASRSISGMSPFFLSDGPQLQVYHALPGDLGNLGYPAEDVQALQGLDRLISQTDRPLRLKPFQLAYSAGSANQFATRSIIERLKRLARSADMIPIFASRYVEIVEGFFSVNFIREAERKWRVTDRGGLQTIRFDEAGMLSIDLAKSEGILGARRINGALYVALDPGVAAPLIALVQSAAPSGMILPGRQIGLFSSNLEVLSGSFAPCLSVFEVTGWGKGEIGVYGDSGAHYQISITAGTSQANGLVIREFDLIADALGYATVEVPTLHGQIETVSLRQQCVGQ